MLSLLKPLQKKKEAGAFFFFLAILGPLFLGLNLAVVKISQSISIDLWILFFLSPVVLVQFPEKGEKILFSSLIALFFFRHSFLCQSHIWEFGLQSSFLVSSWITKLSIGEIRKEISSLQRKKEESFLLLQEKEEAFLEREKSWTKQELLFLEKERNLKELLCQKKEELASLQELTNTVEKNVAFLSQENKELLLEIGNERRKKENSLANAVIEEKTEELTKEKEELHKKIESLQRELFSEKQRHQEFFSQKEELKSLLQTQQKELENLRRTYASYEQLKKQFQEKRKELLEAKKEIFSLEGRLFFQKRKEEEEELIKQEQKYSEELEAILALQEQYETEIALLQGFVSSKEFSKKYMQGSFL